MKTILNLNCKLIYRLINLFLNGLIIRCINLNIIGIANIRLELIYTTILFLSREALRRNVPKLNNIHSIYHYINLIWLIIPSGLIVISFIFLLTFFIQTNHDGNLLAYYTQACLMYALAAVIELLSEPFYLLATVTRNYYINIYIEFIASVIGFGIQTILIIKAGESALLYYGFGYIIYSLIITLSYYTYFLISEKEKRRRLFVITSFNDLLMRPTSPFVDHKLVSETIKFFKQGITMKILTEGEQYLIAIFYLITYEDQAIFHMMYILGSIFPRLIFSTIEQISLNYFQQTKFNSTNQYVQDDQMLLKRRKDDQTYSFQNQQPPTPTEERTIKLNALTLSNKLVRLLILISLLLITFVVPYSSNIMTIYLGPELSKKYSTVFYLRLYLINILLNGVNVINESFIQSIMSIKQLNFYKNLLLIYSLIYLPFSYLFIKFFSISGIIIINCLNLTGRIILNNYLIDKYFIRIQFLKSYLFSSHYIFILLISYVMSCLSQSLIENSFGQIVFASGLILTIICFTLIEEKQTIHYIYCVLKLNNQNRKAQIN